MELEWKDRTEIDGYRILHGNDVDLDLETNTIDVHINGAKVIDENLNIGITLNDRLTNVDGYDIGRWTMIFKQDYKMGQVLDRVPFGIIDKTITGLGATTLEINTDKRSSIIVVPTKALAYNKCQTANDTKGIDYCMYVGSPFGKIKHDTTLRKVKSYIDNRQNQIRKFIVVADSLPMLIDFLTELEENVYTDYFLMVDEIDTMQADSAYRPKLEVVMDCYFRFKFYNRAAVSATMKEFSNPNINKEALLRIEWEKQPKRSLSTLYTSHVDDAAWKVINGLLESSEDKILVAYNSIDGIFNIIKHLNISTSECGILCSERSISKAKMFIDDAELSIDAKGCLLKKITFMTCAYFAGIDIMSSCHLVIVTSHLQPFTYLSTNRMAQIAGRCRLGNLSETIIYDIPEKLPKSYFKGKYSFRRRMIDRANHYSKILNDVSETIRTEPNLLPLQEFINSYMDFISKRKPNSASYPLTIIRQDSLTGKFLPAYFNIDALVEEWELKSFLYTDKNNLVSQLRKGGHTVSPLPELLLSDEEHDAEEIKAIKGKSKVRLYNAFEELKFKLLNWVETGCNEFKLKEIKRDTNKRLQDTVVDPFVLLYQYIPAEALLDNLELACVHERKVRNFINAAIFYALPEEHPFKAAILMSYKVNSEHNESESRYGYDDRINIIKSVFLSVYHYNLKISHHAISDLNSSFFIWARSKEGDRITGVNPFGLPSVIKPMPLNTNILDVIKFPK